MSVRGSAALLQVICMISLKWAATGSDLTETTNIRLFQQISVNNPFSYSHHEWGTSVLEGRVSVRGRGHQAAPVWPADKHATGATAKPCGGPRHIKRRKVAPGPWETRKGALANGMACSPPSPRPPVGTTSPGAWTGWAWGDAEGCGKVGWFGGPHFVGPASARKHCGKFLNENE